MAFGIRTMTAADVPHVTALWNDVLRHDCVSEERLGRVVLEDPNYEPEGALVAEEANGNLLGMSACIVRREPLGKDGGGNDWEFPQGFLKGFVVAAGEEGEKAAARLLAAAESYSAGAGKTHLTATVYTGPYIFPGIDVRYEGLLGVFARNGYRDIATIEDVKTDLRDPGHETRLAELRKRVGPEIETLTWDPSLLPAFRRFVAEGETVQWFQAGWEARYEEPSRDCLVLRRGDDIIGWARYHSDTPVAGFGPILVLPRERGKGYGALLLLECMRGARDAGSESMHAGWANTGFYVAVGWGIDRRYAVLRKDLKRFRHCGDDRNAGISGQSDF